MTTWSARSWTGPAADDSEILAEVPRALRSLVEQLSGVWLDGALHVRGACREPGWHALREVWRRGAGDIPFAETTFGDQLVLCGHDVVRIAAETGAAHDLGTSIGGFVAELERDPVRYLALDPARREPAAPWEPLLAFWFQDCGQTPEQISQLTGRWFGGEAAFDEALRVRFAALLDEAERGGLSSWNATPRGTVAALIALDQLPRNLARGAPGAFALDERAVAIACDAIDRGVDQRVRAVEAVFLYLPLEHSESLDHQRRCVALFEQLAARAPVVAADSFAGFCDYARRHLAVIERFGRFPHRNDVLGRPSSPEERAFLDAGGDSF